MGTRYTKAASTGMRRRPERIRAVIFHPKVDRSVSKRGPKAIVPTLPAAAIPLARAKCLKKDHIYYDGQFLHV